MGLDMIYLDNAATSCYKPEGVYAAVQDALLNASGNPGRSGHKLSLRAGSIVSDTRMALARMFHAESAANFAFCMNATDALNMAIMGIMLKYQDDLSDCHIITSSIEHNSVARPVEYLREKGVDITIVQADIDNGVDPEEVRAAICGNTRLVVINHISNVTGTVNDIGQIGRVCREKGIPFLVDASQSAGFTPIDVQEMHIDLLAFPGHKSLMGPQGTGALYIRPGLVLEPLKRGGTGSHSQMLTQPDSIPDRYESGTVNVPGIAGLGAGIRFILSEGIDAINEKETQLAEKIISGLAEIEGVTIYAPSTGKQRGSVVSFTIDGMDPQDVAMILDEEFDIAVRSGLHCAPYAHRMLGTLETGGTVRVSPGYDNSDKDVDTFIEAIRAIAQSL